VNEKLDLVVFRIKERLFGIDSNEIERVTDRISSKSDKKEKGCYYADELLDMKDNFSYKAELLISAEDDRKYILKVPVLEDMITVNDSDLLPVPELIQEKQDPFFLWGFLESEGELLSLITFDYFS